SLCADTIQPGMAANQLWVIGAFQPVIKPAPGFGGNLVGPCEHCGEVDLHGVDAQPVLSRSTRLMRELGGCYRRLGGCAAEIHTRTAEQLALHDRNSLSRVCKVIGKRHPSLPAADDNHVVVS